MNLSLLDLLAHRLTVRPLKSSSSLLEVSSGLVFFVFLPSVAAEDDRSGNRGFLSRL